MGVVVRLGRQLFVVADGNRRQQRAKMNTCTALSLSFLFLLLLPQPPEKGVRHLHLCRQHIIQMESGLCCLLLVEGVIPHNGDMDSQHLAEDRLRLQQLWGHTNQLQEMNNLLQTGVLQCVLEDHVNLLDGCGVALESVRHCILIGWHLVATGGA